MSERTIGRDIEALGSAGIPVYAVRGCQGGFALLDGFSSDLPSAGPWRDRPAAAAAGTGSGRARARISPRGRRLAALLGRPEYVRIRGDAVPVQGREDWIEVSVRIGSAASAVLDVLALGAEIEVLRPAELRAEVAETARRLAELHAGAAAQ